MRFLFFCPDPRVIKQEKMKSAANVACAVVALVVILVEMLVVISVAILVDVWVVILLAILVVIVHATDNAVHQTLAVRLSTRKKAREEQKRTGPVAKLSTVICPTVQYTVGFTFRQLTYIFIQDSGKSSYTPRHMQIQRHAELN